jgi:hypothetical protein
MRVTVHVPTDVAIADSMSNVPPMLDAPGS